MKVKGLRQFDQNICSNILYLTRKGLEMLDLAYSIYPWEKVWIDEVVFPDYLEKLKASEISSQTHIVPAMSG